MLVLNKYTKFIAKRQIIFPIQYTSANLFLNGTAEPNLIR